MQLACWPPGLYHPARVTPTVLSLCPAPCCIQLSVQHIAEPALLDSTSRPHRICHTTHWICLLPPIPSLIPLQTLASLLCFSASLGLSGLAPYPAHLLCLVCSLPAQLSAELTHLPSDFAAEKALLRIAPLLHIWPPSLAPLFLFLALTLSPRDHGLFHWLYLALQIDLGTQMGLGTKG